MLKTKKFNAVIALEIILSMILYYFVLIGYTAITYAIDLVETNNHNVDFTAYFIDENGEKKDIVKKDIKGEQYLYIDVSVKNEGYFNGIIKIENSNFSIKNEILSSNISEIVNNEIHLNQINAGTTETIKIAIKAIQQETIQYSKFNTKTDIILNGQYVNSKNVEKEQLAEVNGKTQVEIKWVSSSDSQINLSVDTLTNSIFKVNEEDKRVLQLLINSKLNNNHYPIKNTLISLNAPNGTEKTYVFARSTDSTNAQKAFSSNNYIYDDVNNKLNINLVNDDIESISWKKDSTDSFVVTYIINKDQDIKNFIANIDAKLTLYDDRELKLNKSVNINENINKIISNDIETKENSIFKGKLYTGEEREYITSSSINVNFKEPVEKITFKEDVSKFISGENEINANIIYKNTSINKQNFLNIFGEDGYIKVKNENGTIIANINNNTEVNENGDIVLNYVGGEKSLIFETSKPISEGVLKVNNTKAILNTGLTREEINNLSGIKETTLNMYNDNNNIIQGQKIIELKNTTTKANFNVNVENLTSMEKNENVKMEVVLENTNESMDLLQNPTIKITLPKQVKEISAKCKLMYGNGLELSKATIYKENENNIIEIDLTGTQMLYNTEVVNGTTIIIYADITLDKLIENSNEEIKLNYTNELVSNYSDNGEVKKSIKIDGFDKETIQKLQEEEKARALADNTQTTDEIKSTLKAYVGGQEIKEGDIVYTGEIVKYELTLENVGEEDIENVSVEASVPNGTKMIEHVYSYGEQQSEQIKEIESENNIIYKNISKINAKNDKVKLAYEVKINEENNIINNIIVNFNEKSIQNRLGFTAKKAKLNIEVLRWLRGTDYLLNEKEYAYVLNIKNTTNDDLNNVKIDVLSSTSFKFKALVESETSEIITENNSFVIDNIPSGGVYTCFINLIVDKTDDFASIYVVANNTYRSNYDIGQIKTSNIKVELDSNTNENVKLGDNIIYNLKIENNGDLDQNIFNIKQNIPNYSEVKSIILNDESIEFVQSNTNMINKLNEDEENEDEENEEEINGDTYNEENNNKSYSIGFTVRNNVKAGDSINVKINTQIIGEPNEGTENLLSYANINGIYTNSVTHVLYSNYNETVIENFDGDYDGSNNIDQNNEDNNQNDSITEEENEGEKDQTEKENDNLNSKFSISGLIWLDQNENGVRDNQETQLNDIKVLLYNLKDNSIKETTTNNGKYNFDELESGKYIVIFEYNKEKYIITKYKANGVSDSNNSDVENVTLNINGSEQRVSATDAIEVNDANVSNIDLGLIEAKKFDLELTKTIGKVTISNKEGTTVKEYDNANMAKVEIAAKYLSGSTIVIEYNITVKNTGELAGYAKQITDYLPKDLTFNSSLNKDWYQSGEYIYTNSLAENKIEAGETKELKLIVTKKMTETNTGLVNNTAELTSVTNSQNIEDIDSKTGNKQINEDDLGSANVIISVKTGAVISYITVTLLITSLIFVAVYGITKKVIKEN